jgi:hypothetical protein
LKAICLLRALETFMGEVRSLLLALLKHADRIEECPSLRAKRKTYARSEFFSA